MKLSPRTIGILKSFSGINPSILIKQGSKVETLAPSKKIMASAQVDETFEQDFGVYDLNRFLSALSLFKDPELTFTDRQVLVQGDGRTLAYTFAAPETIVSPPPKGIQLPSEDASFKLSSVVLQQVLKAAGVLGASDIVVEGDGSQVTIRAVDHKNPTSHAFSAELGENQTPFKMVFRTETFKFIVSDYDVTISLKKIARFEGDGVTYYVAAESAEG